MVIIIVSWSRKGAVGLGLQWEPETVCFEEVPLMLWNAAVVLIIIVAFGSTLFVLGNDVSRR